MLCSNIKTKIFKELKKNITFNESKFRDLKDQKWLKYYCDRDCLTTLSVEYKHKFHAMCKAYFVSA